MPHIIQLDSCTLALVDNNDVSDCIKTNSEIGVDQFGREKKTCSYVLGQMTLAIELHKSIGHKHRRQATCGWLVPEDK